LQHGRGVEARNQAQGRADLPAGPPRGKRIKVFCFFFSKKKILAVFFFEKKPKKTFIRLGSGELPQ
jgi:hypothetical protein